MVRLRSTSPEDVWMEYKKLRVSTARQAVKSAKSQLAKAEAELERVLAS